MKLNFKETLARKHMREQKVIDQEFQVALMLLGQMEYQKAMIETQISEQLKVCAKLNKEGMERKQSDEKNQVTPVKSEEVVVSSETSESQDAAQ